MKIFYRELLKEGKTIEWFSKKMEVSTQAVYDWKNGVSKPNPVKLKKIAKILNLDVNVLIDDFY